MTEKLNEELDGRLIVTHLPEEDDLEVLNAALAKMQGKSFAQTMQEEDKMAPSRFQKGPFDAAAEFWDVKPALPKSLLQELQEEVKITPVQFQDESFDYDAESRDSEPMTTIKPDDEDEDADEIGDAIGGAIDTVVDNTQETIEALQGLLASIGDLVPQIPGIPAQALDMLCVAVWWPLQETHCKETRCAVCSPGILSAISVCKAAFKTADHKCVQEVMGEGFCNYCIADFLA